MLKKMLAALVASAMLASISATALAMPDETPAPEETTIPADTAAPAETPAPTETPIDPAVFTEQVKAMVASVVELRAQLVAEKQLDQKLRSEIASLRSVYMPDPQQMKTYRDQVKALEKQVRELTQQLNRALRGTGKNKVVDEQLVAELRAKIAEVKAQKTALEEQLAGIVKANQSARSTLKEFRALLKAEYEKLRPLFQASNVLKEQLYTLIDQLKAAIAAEDIVTATDLLAQITVKVDELKDNINQRIAIREGITQMLVDYKASLTQ